MTDFLYGLLCGSAAVICLSARFLYEDKRMKLVCLIVSGCFLLAAAASFFPPDISYDNAMFLNACATLALAGALSRLQAHYALITVCLLMLYNHTFGFLIAISNNIIDISVYNYFALTLDIIFVVLLLALSDAGLSRIRRIRDKARYFILLRTSYL